MLLLLYLLPLLLLALLLLLLVYPLLLLLLLLLLLVYPLLLLLLLLFFSFNFVNEALFPFLFIRLLLT